jgi:hypothetical protein
MICTVTPFPMVISNSTYKDNMNNYFTKSSENELRKPSSRN